MNFKNLIFYIKKIDVSDFKDTQSIMRDPYFIEEVDKFLEYISLKKDYSNKIFSTCFLIKNHSSQIFENTNEFYSKLIISSTSVISELKSILDKDNISQESFIKFKTLFINFHSCFLKWDSEDENILINNLIKKYCELESESFNLKEGLKSNDISNDLIDKNKNNIELINNEKDKILLRIKKIGGDKVINHFNNFVPVFINEDFINNLFKQITDNYHKAYWDILREEISNNNFVGVLKILKEIKMLLKNLLPNNQKFHNELDEYIDIDFLDQLIKNNVFEKENMQNLVFYIILNIKKLQSPSDDDDTEVWGKKMLSDLNEGMSYQDFLPIFFKISLDKLIKINNEVNIIKKSDFYSNLKSNLRK